MESNHPVGSMEFNKEFILNHFEEFVNKKNSAVAYENLAADFLDHDETGGAVIGPEPAKIMMEALYKAIPDIYVSVEDIVAEGDKVMVRNIWSGKNTNGRRIQFKGFVLWRLSGEKIVERWATVTPSYPVEGAAPSW